MIRYLRSAPLSAILGASALLAWGCSAPPQPSPPVSDLSPAPLPDNNMKHIGVIEEGMPAPLFDLPSNNGSDIALSDFVNKQVVVLYFYPKADTPGCTKEACGFRDAIAAYQDGNIAVLGVSPDSVGALDRFRDKYRLNFPLLADENHKVAEAYGVWQEKNSFGQNRWGTVRTTFVIGKDGVIAHVFENVKPENHDQEVLAWLKQSGLLEK